MTNQENPKRNSRSWIVIFALLSGSAAALLYSARRIEGFAEWYSSSIYPLIEGTTGRLSGILPFSLAELLVLLLPVIIIADAFRSRKRIGLFLQRMLLLLAVLAFLYSANCGVNYYRDPFVAPEVYSETSFTAEQLEEFCKYAAYHLRQNSEAPAGDGFDYPDRTDLASSAVSAMKKLGGSYGSLSGYYPRAKTLSVLSRLFSNMGVSGVYSPFTVEANINGEMPGMEKPFTSCHELSHLKGYMNEGEANYIGWLACIGSDDPAFVRSGWLIAWNYAGVDLYRADPKRYEAAVSFLPEDALRELAENHDFWENHKTKASDVQDRVNDAYLKSNGLEDGIHSYGNLTTLMMAWYLSEQNELSILD